jgi:hypothetical protein
VDFWKKRQFLPEISYKVLSFFWDYNFSGLLRRINCLFPVILIVKIVIVLVCMHSLLTFSNGARFCAEFLVLAGVLVVIRAGKVVVQKKLKNK